MAFKKETIAEMISTHLDSFYKDELSNKDFSILCLVSDEEGVGEIMVGSGESLVSSLAHAFLDNDNLVYVVKTALDVVEHYKKEHDAYVKLAEMADTKYKS